MKWNKNDHRFEYDLQCPYVDCEASAQPQSNSHNLLLLHRCQQCFRLYEWKREFSNGKRSSFFWPLLADARFNTLSGQQISHRSSLSCSEYGNRGRTSHVPEFKNDREFFRQRSHRQYQFTQQKAFFQEDSDGDIRTNKIQLEFPTIAIVGLALWQDWLIVVKSNATLFVYENALQMVRPHHPMKFLRKMQVGYEQPSIEVVYPPCVVGHNCLIYCKLKDSPKHIGYLWDLQNSTYQVIHPKEGFTFWGPPMSMGMEDQFFFVITEKKQQLRGQFQPSEITVRLRIVTTQNEEIVVHEHCNYAEDGFLPLAQLAASPVYCPENDVLVLLRGGITLLPTALTTILLRIPKDIQHMPKEQRWEAILQYSKFQKKTNNLENFKEGDMALLITPQEYPLMTISPDYVNKLVITYIHQNKDFVYIFEGSVHIEDNLVEWTIKHCIPNHDYQIRTMAISTMRAYTVFGTPNAYIVCSNGNKEAIKKKIDKAAKNTTEFEPAIFTPYGLIVRNEHGLEMELHKEYDFKHPFKGLSGNILQDQNEFCFADIEIGQGIAYCGDIFFVSNGKEIQKYIIEGKK